MKTYISPKARYIHLELEAMIAESNITTHEEYGNNDYFSNKRDNSIWDND